MMTAVSRFLNAALPKYLHHALWIALDAPENRAQMRKGHKQGQVPRKKRTRASMKS